MSDEQLPAVVRKVTGRPFVKGQSGNPVGRPPKGYSKAELIRERITDRVDELVDVLFKAAEKGDTNAASALLKLAIPALKPIEQSIVLNVPSGAGLAEMGQVVMAAGLAGQLSPQQTQQLMFGLAQVIAVHNAEQIAEIERRITKNGSN